MKDRYNSRFINLLMSDRLRRNSQKEEDTARLLANKVMSDRPHRKEERVLRRKNTETIPEAITYMLMKEKFDQIYKRIEKISLKDEQLVGRVQRKGTLEANDSTQMRIVHFLDQPPSLSPQPRGKIASMLPKRSHPSAQDESLEVKTMMEQQGFRPKGEARMRRSRYRKKMLEPLQAKMSNNIKDYLSVGKILIRQTEDSASAQKAKMLKKYNQQSNLLAFKQPLASSGSAQLPQIESPKKESWNLRKSNKFKPPFELYYYRDFIWKVGFNSGIIVQPPNEYESRLKYFVGSGNNSNLIKGIMKRRPWFILTDKSQQSVFAWTQIKLPSYFSTQKSTDKVIPIDSQQRELLEQAAQIREKLGKVIVILSEDENQQWQTYWQRHQDKERNINENMKIRSKILGVNTVKPDLSKNTRIHNHLCNNFLLGNKKALFSTMSEYFDLVGLKVFDYLPLTFHIKSGLQDPDYLIFLQHFYTIAKSIKTQEDPLHRHNAWIVKPGQNTNRGNGIVVCLQLSQIKAILRKQQKHADGTLKTYILQKYIERPLLYRRRKFDLRHYMLMSCMQGRMKGYWYKQGYVRTTSSEYTLKISSGGVHLTNDAVQKTLPDYGRYQKGNKITYQQLDDYQRQIDPNFSFWKLVYPKMKELATHCLKAAAANFDPMRRQHNFELFGLDFMIDEHYGVWLIQVNTNPCLQTTCPVLANIIPPLIQDVFQLCIDPIFPAPIGFTPKKDHFRNPNETNQFELVFDERIYGSPAIGEAILASNPQQEDDVFQDDGDDCC